MSLTVLGSNGGGAYNIESSLRFRSTASAYLSRTFTTPTNSKKMTLSFWYKHTQIGTNSNIFANDGAIGTDDEEVYINSSNTLVFFHREPSSEIAYTNAIFRDPSAWYHMVVAIDTTQATASDRLKMYVNGEEQSLATNSVSLNQTLRLNSAGVKYIGRRSDGLYLDGYLTEYNFIDGQQLTADDFGEYDTTTGVWKPKKYTGTYGTNGFYLEGCRGTDQSGNGNDFTENNFNTTSSTVNYDIMNDVPTLTDEDTANFPTYNILFPLSTSTVDNGNIRLVNSGTSSWRHAISSIALPNTGKWYFEMAASVDTNNGHMGLAPVESLANGSNGYVTDAILTNTPNSSGTAAGGLAGSTQTWTGTYNINALEALACAVDMDANKVWFRIGSNWVDAGSGAGDPASGTNPAVSGGINYNKTYHFITSAYAQNHYVNFGQRPFAYTVPTGFKKLNTYNLPDSTIADGSQYMNTVLYTGDGDLTSHPITGVGFSPDWIWIKRRDSANSHQTYDSVRTLGYVLSTDKTNAEADETSKFVSIDSDGFTIKSNAGSHNLLNATYVAWNWRGSDSSAVSNTDGDITSTVSANTSSGFSVVTYTGTGANATVGHGLGVAPQVVIVKSRSATGSWIMNHPDIDAGEYLLLDSNAAAAGSAAWQSTRPSSSVFYVTSGTSYGANGVDYVAYCFAEVEGFSQFGSYIGNGSADGTFVYTGFRPAFVLTKSATEARNWVIIDTTRDPNNLADQNLEPNTSNAEFTNADDMDILSNGFKMRTANPGANGNGQTIIYMAFAENPFKNSLAR